MIHVVYVQADDIKHEAAEQEFKATSLTGKKRPHGCGLLNSKTSKNVIEPGFFWMQLHRL